MEPKAGRKSKKYERYYGEPYAYKTLETVFVCRHCGWERPVDSRSLDCGRCGHILSKVLRKKEVQ